jgi:3alpha(or 20beta)-hydroxysteroid dehydrogenase
VTVNDQDVSPECGSLTGKVLVVTGAGRGQGFAEARHLTAAGAAVIGVDLEMPPEAAEQVALACEFDVSDQDSWTDLAKRIDEDFGRVDGLVNNAAMAAREPLLEVSRERWDRTLAVNLTGPLLAMQALVPLMRDGGSIVNISSVAGLTGHRTTAYTASKWGLRGLSLLASNELGGRGIRVNTVFPGYIDTPLVRQNPESFRSASLKLIPMGRLGTVTDVAPLVAFLLGDESSWITGAEIVVDGGQSAHGGTRLLSDPAGGGT